jgi:processive 1,2-diacylglycerol beta-glucosyltransferase
MHMRRILILHAAVGTGHTTPARALAKAFQMRQVEQVWCEDALAYGSKVFREIYAGSYLELSEKMPTLWAYCYERTDQNETELSKDLRTLIDRIGVTELAALVRQRRPDAVICTHFLPLNLLAWAKRKQRLTVPLYCVVTDYTGHIYWVEPDVEGYFVATPETGQLLARRGVDAARIRVTGIPVDPAIAIPKDPMQMRQVHHLDRAPVVTLVGGGLAVERVEHLIHGLMRRGFPGTLLVVAGRNTKLEAGLQHVRSSPTLTLRVLGFVDYLDDLVAASDLVITKAGGLMVSEIMARQTPMLLIDPIPGQEEWNADYVVSVGAGVQLRLLDMVPVAVDHLLQCPSRLAELRAGAARAGQPQAALKVAEAVLADHHAAMSKATGAIARE